MSCYFSYLFNRLGIGKIVFGQEIQLSRHKQRPVQHETVLSLRNSAVGRQEVVKSDDLQSRDCGV